MIEPVTSASTQAAAAPGALTAAAAAAATADLQAAPAVQAPPEAELGQQNGDGQFTGHMAPQDFTRTLRFKQLDNRVRIDVLDSSGQVVRSIPPESLSELLKVIQPQPGLMLDTRL